MNREQRRRQAKEQRRANSKKNFVYAGMKEVPIDKLQHDPNLKECDQEIVDLISKHYEWAERGLVKNELSKCIIMKGCDYLDSLCSFRFDITMPDDKASVRDTMYYVGNLTNMFYGLMIDNKSSDLSLFERSEECQKNGQTQMNVVLVHKLYPQCSLPDKSIIDNLYAEFLAGHAQELSSLLLQTRKSDIKSDEKYVFEVLDMILKKTDKLLPEAQVNSEQFVVCL